MSEVEGLPMESTHWHFSGGPGRGQGNMTDLDGLNVDLSSASTFKSLEELGEGLLLADKEIPLTFVQHGLELAHALTEET